MIFNKKKSNEKCRRERKMTLIYSSVNILGDPSEIARDENRKIVAARSAMRRHCPFANHEPRVGTTGNPRLVGRYRYVQISSDNVIA